MTEEQEMGIPMHIAYPNNESTLQFQIIVEEELREFEHNIKKEISTWNAEKGILEWRTPPGVKPVMNDQGINSVMMALRPSVSKIIILGNIDTERAEKIALDTAKSLIGLVREKWDEYEISSPAEASAMVRTATNLVMATLSKAEKGTYLKFLRYIQNFSEHQAVSNGRGEHGEKKSWLSKLFGAKT